MADVYIAGVDPGPTGSALVVLRRDPAGGCRVEAHAHLPNSELVAMAQRWVARTAGAGLRLLVGIERPKTFGMAAADQILSTAIACGRIEQGIYDEWAGLLTLAGCDTAACPCPETMYATFSTIRQHHCHHGHAKEANIKVALIDRFGAPGTRKAPGWTYGLTTKDHAWSALAVAVWRGDTAGLLRL